MAILTREAILNASDLLTEVVEVPEWGGSVIVRGLSGAERDHFESSVVEMDGKKVKVKSENMRAKLVALCVVDETGARIFSDQDVAALGQKSAAALDRVFQAAQRLSGLTEVDVQELEKNS